MKPVIKFTITREHLRKAASDRPFCIRAISCPIAYAIHQVVSPWMRIIVNQKIVDVAHVEYPLPEPLQEAIRYWDRHGDTNFEHVLNKEWELTPLLRRKNYETSD